MSDYDRFLSDKPHDDGPEMTYDTPIFRGPVGGHSGNSGAGGPQQQRLGRSGFTPDGRRWWSFEGEEKEYYYDKKGLIQVVPGGVYMDTDGTMRLYSGSCVTLDDDGNPVYEEKVSLLEKATDVVAGGALILAGVGLGRLLYGAFSHWSGAPAAGKDRRAGPEV